MFRIPIFVIVLFAIFSRSLMSGQAQPNPSSRPPCTLVTPEVVEAVLKLHGPPAMAANGGCSFIVDNFEQPFLQSDREFSSVAIQEKATYDLLVGQASFKPNLVAELEGDQSQCDAGFEIEHQPALWCFRKDFGPGRGRYNLWILTGAEPKFMGFSRWTPSPSETKQDAILLARVALFHQPVPPGTLKWDTQWAHSPHQMKPGVWQLTVASRGEGYLFLGSGASVFYTCVRDGGSSLLKLLPVHLKDCDRRVRQVSSSEEEVAAYCAKSAVGTSDMSDLYRFHLKFIDAQHYGIEGQQQRSDMALVKRQLATEKEKQQIGERQIAVQARWLQSDCGLDPEEHLSSPFQGIIP